MKKTISINLAGFFFHIDEDAYNQLQDYLEAIKRSMQNEENTNEIIADIESRIAELFSERITSDQQVVSSKIVDEIINIMGQPEDYNIDDSGEGTQSENYRNRTKRLYRDKDNAFVGGVSAGLGHFFGVDAIWIRLVWVLLVFGFGTGLLLYALLWVFVPPAKTTAEKLSMMGKPIDITTIEQQVKEGVGNVKNHIDKVAEKVKQHESVLQTKSKSFFEKLGVLIQSLLEIAIKVLGYLLVISGILAMLGTVISFFAFGISGIYLPGIEIDSVLNTSLMPLWVISLVILIVAIIPLLFIVMLGLKLVGTKFNPLNKSAVITLIVLWIIALGTLITFSVQQLVDFKETARVEHIENLNVKKGDTLFLSMRKNINFADKIYRNNNFKIITTVSGEKLMYNADVRLIVRTTKDSLASIAIEKKAKGESYQRARERAQAIDYQYEFKNYSLYLNAYYTTSPHNKFRDQKITVVLYLPEDSFLYADKNTYSFHRNYSSYDDVLDNGQEEQLLKVQNNALEQVHFKPTTNAHTD